MAKHDDDLGSKLILEAQIHAMEARTMSSIVHYIYQGLGIQKGTWCGAEPVLEKYTELQHALAQCDRLQRQLGSNAGLCDAIDNDGEPYQSQHLADLIAAAKRSV